MVLITGVLTAGYGVHKDFPARVSSQLEGNVTNPVIGTMLTIEPFDSHVIEKSLHVTPSQIALVSE